MLCCLFREKLGAGLLCVSLLAGSSYIKGQNINDSLLYTAKMQQLANHDRSGLWPAKIILPKKGAVLPFRRIVAYYGNFYCEQMGVLGQGTQKQMIEKLNAEIKIWEKADTLTPVIAAIHYIAVTAQANPGADNCHRLRMPFTEIDKAIAIAKQVNGIVFLDIQVGLSSLEKELPLLSKYLSMEQVHLGIDPEYSMKNKKRPGTSIGTFDAEDVNYAVKFLTTLVKNNNLPPKILVVHRFTNAMLTNYKKILPTSEVQLVINMDGFGNAAKKKSSYYHAIFKEPVEFTGFKLFYKYDNKLMSPSEILQLKPIPSYIQYQ